MSMSGGENSAVDAGPGSISRQSSMDGLRQTLHAMNESALKPAIEGIKSAAGKTVGAVGHAGAAVGAGVQAAADRVGLGNPVRAMGEGVKKSAHYVTDAAHTIAVDLHGDTTELETLPASMVFRYKRNGGVWLCAHV